ncbi:MAG: acyl carrier protein [Paludibacteraceae bacterium]|jgi:acyl carrier protein|nr:acyl carrier protein [Paludibacteraceae bacterium]
MDKQLIINKINDGLANEFEKDAATFLPDADMRQTLELDSLDMVDLVVLIEEDFGIKVKKEDFSSIKTFKNLYDFLDSRINR